MGNMLASWEDEENNRQIQFAVEYTVAGPEVQINSVTPNKVSFVCPDTNTCLRSVGVHTSTGRDLLAARILKSGRMQELTTEIAQRYNVAVAI